MGLVFCFKNMRSEFTFLREGSEGTNLNPFPTVSMRESVTSTTVC